MGPLAMVVLAALAAPAAAVYGPEPDELRATPRGVAGDLGSAQGRRSLIPETLICFGREKP